MTRAQLLSHLDTLDACHESIQWVRGTRGNTAHLWDACPRGDWMLWLATRAGVDRRWIVLAACDCARLALHHVKPGELRPLRAIEAAEAWTRGDASIAQVRSAAASADAASAAAASYASYAASYAAYAAYAASAASYASAAAAAAASAAAVRARIPWATVASALEVAS